MLSSKQLTVIAASAVLMVLLPWLAVTVVSGEAGMAVCFLLFFAVNPIAAVAVGIFSGRSLRTAWFQPAALAVLFLAGVWLNFDMGEPAFLLYAAAYFLLGSLTMLLTWALHRRRRHIDQ